MSPAMANATTKTPEEVPASAASIPKRGKSEVVVVIRDSPRLRGLLAKGWTHPTTRVDTTDRAATPEEDPHAQFDLKADRRLSRTRHVLDFGHQVSRDIELEPGIQFSNTGRTGHVDLSQVVTNQVETGEEDAAPA